MTRPMSLGLVLAVAAVVVTVVAGLAWVARGEDPDLGPAVLISQPPAADSGAAGTAPPTPAVAPSGPAGADATAPPSATPSKSPSARPAKSPQSGASMSQSRQVAPRPPSPGGVADDDDGDDDDDGGDDDD